MLAKGSNISGKNNFLFTVKILDRKNIDFQIVLTGDKKSQKNKNVYLEFNNLLKKNNLKNVSSLVGTNIKP